MQQKKRKTMRCKVCRKESKYKCSKCLFATYCSTHCQQQDWEAHSEKCQKIGMPKRKKEDETEEEKRQRIRRLEEEIAEAKKEIADLHKRKRNAPDENPLSSEEKQKLKEYLENWSRKPEWSAPWDNDFNWKERFVEVSYYVDVSIEAPENSDYEKEFSEFSSVELAALEKVTDSLRQQPSFDPEIYEYAEDAYASMVNYGIMFDEDVEIFVTDAIIELMRRAHITLILQPMKYSRHLHDYHYDEPRVKAGEPVTWGF